MKVENDHTWWTFERKLKLRMIRPCGGLLCQSLLLLSSQSLLIPLLGFHLLHLHRVIFATPKSVSSINTSRVSGLLRRMYISWFPEATSYTFLLICFVPQTPWAQFKSELMRSISALCLCHDNYLVLLFFFFLQN